MSDHEQVLHEQYMCLSIGAEHECAEQQAFDWGCGHDLRFRAVHDPHADGACEVARSVQVLHAHQKMLRPQETMRTIARYGFRSCRIGEASHPGPCSTCGATAYVIHLPAKIVTFLEHIIARSAICSKDH